ncbi:ATP-dependent Clp protease adaptor ClpS [bacterium]|nr:ATP-dependent Clp protease adaptor ClpS [bacterium]
MEKIILSPKAETKKKPKVIVIPKFNVVLLNDEEHTYDYVVEMLCKIFNHSLETAFQMAVEVDTMKRVVVYTTYKEKAEVKRDQIRSFGADWRLPNSRGSMNAVIEAVN